MTDTTKAGRTPVALPARKRSGDDCLDVADVFDVRELAVLLDEFAGGPAPCTIGRLHDLGVSAAITGMGIVYLFEDWLEPHLASGALEPCWSRGG